MRNILSNLGIDFYFYDLLRTTLTSLRDLGSHSTGIDRNDYLWVVQNMSRGEQIARLRYKSNVLNIAFLPPAPEGCGKVMFLHLPVCSQEVLPVQVLSGQVMSRCCPGRGEGVPSVQVLSDGVPPTLEMTRGTYPRQDQGMTVRTACL